MEDGAGGGAAQTRGRERVVWPTPDAGVAHDGSLAIIMNHTCF